MCTDKIHDSYQCMLTEISSCYVTFNFFSLKPFHENLMALISLKITDLSIILQLSYKNLFTLLL